MAAPVAITLFVGMLLFLELGYRLGGRHLQRNPDAHEGIGAIEASVFALLGLLLGFAFAGAMSRLDARRDLIVRETNAIGSAYHLVDLLPAADQPAIRHLFRDYLEARLRVYEPRVDVRTADARIQDAVRLQESIWRMARDASRAAPDGDATRQLLPALLDMMDVTTARTVALHARLPGLILAVLVAMALLSALMAGYSKAKRRVRSWFHALAFAASVSLTVYAVLDLDNPRSGLIRLDATERVLAELREAIH